MIDKVILDIAHSDDYTDYLFMTAALTNSRVIPLIDPSAEELRRQSDGNAFIFKCRNSRKALESGDGTVRADQYSHTIWCFRGFIWMTMGRLTQAMPRS